MRRNMSRGQRAEPSSGPLMTDHLKLQDLDLELELLKRKREIIEMQQRQAAMLEDQHYNNRQMLYDFDYNEPRPYQEQYPEPSYSGGLLGKRPAMEEWGSAPKHFCGPQGGPTNKFGANTDSLPAGRLEPWSHPPQSLLDIPTPQFGMPGPGRYIRRPTPPHLIARNERRLNAKLYAMRKEANPNIVTKNKAKPANASNKLLATGTPQQRKVVAEEMTKLPIVKKVEHKVDDFVLKPDVEPSLQLAGRLELALGLILKEIRNVFGNKEPHIVSFQSQYLQRRMKQAIRDRLRSVMMRKFVGKGESVVASYRKVFPPSTDIEIVRVAQEAQRTLEKQNNAMKLNDADTPEGFFKNNMNRLVSAVLDDMFAKLKNLYCGNEVLCVSIDKNKDKNTAIDTDNKVGKQNDDVKVKIENEQGTQNAGWNALKMDMAYQDIKNLENLIDSILKCKLPQLLPKFKNVLIKLVDVNKMYELTKQKIEARLADKMMAVARVEEFSKKNEVGAKLNDSKNVTTIRETPAPGALPYYVKVFARPVLPNRKMMQAFLQQFKPKSVKKHKNMHLLFVGFENKADFDKLVAVKGTIINNSTISIKASEKIIDSSDSEVQVLEDDAMNVSIASDESVIGKELDDQINDLLSSIRNEEERLSLKSEAIETEANENEAIATEANENEAIETEANKNETTETTGAETENPEAKENGTDKSDEVAISNIKTEEVSPLKTECDEKLQTKLLNEDSENKLEALKTENQDGRATPTRPSTRLANVTPSTVRTRRASKLAQN